MSQTFYATRVWRLLPQPGKMIGPLCMALSSLNFMLAMAAGAHTQLGHLPGYRARGRWMATSVLIVSAFLDVILASAMVYYLHSERKKILVSIGYLVRSTRLVDRVMQYTICTGALTAAAVAISFSAETGSTIYLAIFTCHTKLYSNSMIALLNARTSLRSIVDETSRINFSSRILGSSRQSKSTDIESSQVALEEIAKSESSHVEDSVGSKPGLSV
ncbi:hypothetical protein CC1G_08402 [Coprinopsis cinerea okayama7|uniref:DUF6534 domain-containing protein n=1 Tax=Coprinopsis cinerea (strain Okayama-7 / 130 / ATCC MYA-4618 / FGSC 9003) TaxID=240176 RepID=A8NAN3_COPC7|nr:hypothetical protein CC1G_08402 [Coprinopsis cinerea okayama7\|eukprot:XP_001831885.2 hypothetical protein CC1G_08402 [Coprinopsis cinerea okayama7\